MLHNDSNREFKFSDENFQFISKLIGEKTGIVLHDHKKGMVYSRLTKRLRDLEYTDFNQYIEHIQSANDDEMINLVNAITTNLTKFFRESHHFTHLTKHLQQLVDNGQKKIRIWSAGCSSGMEPYSIAITILESFKNMGGLDIKILATDIDSNMLKTGSNGIYEEDNLKDLEAGLLDKYFNKIGPSQYQAIDKLKQLISFKKLNLLESWPMKGDFDIIFCRNVVIYFSKETQHTLFNRYHEILKENGILYIGHSENLLTVKDKFENLSKTTYRKMG